MTCAVQGGAGRGIDGASVSHRWGALTPAILFRRVLKFDGLRELRYSCSLVHRENHVITNQSPVGWTLIGNGMGTRLSRARTTFNSCQAVVIYGYAQDLGYPRAVRGLLHSGIPSYGR